MFLRLAYRLLEYITSDIVDNRKFVLQVRNQTLRIFKIVGYFLREHRAYITNEKKSVGLF